jgi:hypothetical protein
MEKPPKLQRINIDIDAGVEYGHYHHHVICYEDNGYGRLVDAYVLRIFGK